LVTIFCQFGLILYLPGHNAHQSSFYRLFNKQSTHVSLHKTQ
jgi:hypothetical protein